MVSCSRTEELGEHRPGLFASYTTTVFPQVSGSWLQPQDPSPGSPAACCFITFLWSQKSLLCLVWLLKMCLAFFLKIKPQSRDERKSLELVQRSPVLRWEGEAAERPEQGRGPGRRLSHKHRMNRFTQEMSFDAQTQPGPVIGEAQRSGPGTGGRGVEGYSKVHAATFSWEHEAAIKSLLGNLKQHMVTASSCARRLLPLLRPDDHGQSSRWGSAPGAGQLPTRGCRSAPRGSHGTGTKCT